MVARASVPALAIGGITSRNIDEVMQTGVRGVAVMGGVMRATDPGDEMGKLLAAFASAARRTA
jgi:thiamine-phosphate pyrophosphorylase